MMIDKLTKKGYVYRLESKNHIHKTDAITEYLTRVGSPKKVITDNEFNTAYIRDYFRERNIDVHFTKPNAHTGNADIERLHSTIAEILLTMNQEESVNTKMFRAFQIYNKRYHTTIGMSPEQVQHTNIEAVVKRLENRKTNVINKRNQGRDDYTETRQVGCIKNYKHVRHKNEPNFRLKKLDRVHTINIKRPKK